MGSSFIVWTVIVLSALKLSDQIAWSWLAVFSPLIVLFTAGFVAGFINGFMKARRLRQGKGGFKV